MAGNDIPVLGGKFLPFVLPPLVLGIVIATIATLTLRKMRPTSDQPLTSFVFNATLLAASFLAAEFYKDYLIDRALDGHHPTCVSTRSFISSLQNAGPSHAYVEEDGKRYHWSYSERRFVDATGYTLVCEPQCSPGQLSAPPTRRTLPGTASKPASDCSKSSAPVMQNDWQSRQLSINSSIRHPETICLRQPAAQRRKPRRA